MQLVEELRETAGRAAKSINFGIVYGMSPYGLSQQLQISTEQAKTYIEKYFERYPGVKKYLDETVEKARKDGFVSTYFKRRRYIPEITSKDPRFKSFAERTAINAPVQGTSSDVIKIAMIKIQEKIEKQNLASRMILQVHDELLFETPKDELEKLVSLATHEMQQAVAFKVPMKVSVKAGLNWLDMEEIH